MSGSSASAEPKQEAPTEDDTARSAGRGGVAIALAKIYFMVVGLVQQIALKHVLGLQSYGALGRVQGLASVVYNPVISTAVQGVSRATSQSPEETRAQTQRKVLTIHAALVLPLAAMFGLGAPVIASAIRAPHLTLPLRIIAVVMLAYGLYTPLVGVLNGARRFGAQAALDVCAATLRTIGLLGGAWWLNRRGLGVEGALGGFACAATLMVGIALPLAKTGRRGGGPSWGEHLRFVAPLFAGQFALNLLFQSDLQLLGRFAADAAVVAGQPVEAADTLAGAYRNAQLFCFLPYQLLLAITFVLFPLLAKARADDDSEAVARYTATGVRLAAILGGAMVSVTAGMPAALLNLVFGPDSAALAAPAMRIMALGLGSFAIFGILVTVLTSLGKEGVSAGLTVAALGLVVALCFALVWRRPYGPDLLVRTALATGAGLVSATLLAAWQVHRVAGAIAPLGTVVRIPLAVALTATLLAQLPAPGKLMTLGYATLAGMVYLVLLIATRELGKADLALVSRVAGR